MPLRRDSALLLVLTLAASGTAYAQSAPRLEWKERPGPAATRAPQLPPFQATPLTLPRLLASTGASTSSPFALAAGRALVDERPSCAMPVAEAAAGQGDSMPVTRTDVEKLERMPVVPSRCRSTP